MPDDITPEVVPPEALTAAQKLLSDAIEKVEASNITALDAMLEGFRELKGELRGLQSRIEAGNVVPASQLTARQREALKSGERKQARGFLVILEAAIRGDSGDDEGDEPEPDAAEAVPGVGGGPEGSGDPGEESGG